MKLYLEIPVIVRFAVLTLLCLPKCFGYIKLHFGNERNSLCNKVKIFGTSTQHLRHHDNSGLIVEEEFPYHQTEWKEDLICTFKVNPPPGTNGVIAVIQSLNMRRNESSGECIDYIVFKAKDGTNSDEFCGKFDVVSKMNIKQTTLDVINYGNSFRTKGHKMYVNITFGKHPFKRSNEKIDFKIVFTAYRNCSQDTLMDLSYKRCKDTSDICLYTGFFNDGFVNCPLAGCVDEGSCSKFIPLPKPPSIGTKLLVSSISFFFVLFVTFLISIWACKKHKVICFSDQFSQPSRVQQTRVIELSEQGRNISTENHQLPTAPPPIEVDKDLPPKYEDLFPDR